MPRCMTSRQTQLILFLRDLPLSHFAVAPLLRGASAATAHDSFPYTVAIISFPEPVPPLGMNFRLRIA